MDTASPNEKTYIGAAAILEKKQKYIIPCLGHFYHDPRQIVRGEMQYLYDDGEFCQFMDTATYEQVAISDEDVGDVKKWMIDGMMVEILFHNGKAIGVEVPQVVELKIVETPPNFKGDTQGGKKPATLESGAVVQIPFHVLEGEVIRVDTVRGEYIERANK